MWTYQDWALAYGEPRGPVLDPADAGRRYDAGQRITVVVGDDPDRPSQVLQAHRGGRLVVVSWLDALLREELTYVFHARTDRDWPAGTLLLERVHVLTYADDRTPPFHVSAHDDTTWFRPDGQWHAARQARGSGQHETSSGELPVDQLQAAAVPAFGDWAPLLTQDR